MSNHCLHKHTPPRYRNRKKNKESCWCTSLRVTHSPQALCWCGWPVYLQADEPQASSSHLAAPGTQARRAGSQRDRKVGAGWITPTFIFCVNTSNGFDIALRKVNSKAPRKNVQPPGRRSKSAAMNQGTLHHHLPVMQGGDRRQRAG